MKKSKARLSHWEDVLVWNRKTILLNRYGNEYQYVQEKECFYEIVITNNGTRTKIEKELEPNEIYVAKLDRSKNQRSLENLNGLWIFGEEDNNVDPITQEEIKNDIEYLGILVVIAKKENHNNNNCWEPICNHVFDYDSLKEWILSDSFTGCPICRAGRHLTNPRYTIGPGLVMEPEINHSEMDDEGNHNAVEVGIQKFLESVSRSSHLETIQWLSDLESRYKTTR